MIWTMDGLFFCIPIFKRVNEVAPSTALGTEEWGRLLCLVLMRVMWAANTTRLK